MSFASVSTSRSLISRLFTIFAILTLSLLVWKFPLTEVTLRPIWGFGVGNEVGDGPCADVPGLDDILVVFRTGASEAPFKAPVHFETTLRCVPHYALYSDFEEDIAGHHFEDALDEVDDDIKRTNPDFGVYNQLQSKGRDAFTAADITRWMAVKNTPNGKLDNPNWKLDKWKFLPLVDKALQFRRDAKWYVFVEADSYLMWPSLVRWLSRFDASQPLYIGYQMHFGQLLFAYGGASFIVSNPAMRKVSDGRRQRLAEYDEFTAAHWAGDTILGWAFQNEGISLHWAWPHLQGERPEQLDYTAVLWDRKMWCYQAISYHHMSTHDIRLMSQFEQSWARTNSSLPRHGDVFKAYILPRIQAAPTRVDWDNTADPGNWDHVHDSAASFEECFETCKRDSDCKQYAYASDGKCQISSAIRLGKEILGEASPASPSTHATGIDALGLRRVSSGWLLDRVLTSMEERRCEGEAWLD